MSLPIDSVFVELSFRLQGTTIPVDHGYVLFSAMSMVLPELHVGEEDSIGVVPVAGRAVGGRRMTLLPTSRLILRIPQRRLAEFLPLAGKTLPLPGGALVVGTPEVRLLQPCDTLYSRLVTIKLRECPTSSPGHSRAFITAVERQLGLLGIHGTAITIPNRRHATSFEGKKGSDSSRGSQLRRTLSVRGKKIVGYAIKIAGLSAEDSITLQAAGIGGRRHFGCGVFVPSPALP